MAYVANLDGDHLDWLRERVSLLLVSARARGRTRTGALPSTPPSPRCSATRASGTSWTCGATTSRTTGRPGAPSSPITYRGSADGGRDEHLIGLLLGTEEDWPRAFETLLRRVGPSPTRGGSAHSTTERVTIEPFDLRAKPRHDLVIDRLAYWYYHPREWLKKVALMDDVYLLNSPFTFQSMEKHAAYCAMMRLGLKVPDTVLVPYKNPPDNARYAYTAARYNRPFDLDAIAEDGRLSAVHEALRRRRWVGVSRIRTRRAAPRVRRVRAAADAPAGAVDGFDVFARSSVHRRRDDGDELRPGPADARPVLGRRTTSSRRRWATRYDHLAARQRVLPLGVQLLRDADQGPRCTRSTTPTPARTSRSPACTTTSRGR